MLNEASVQAVDGSWASEINPQFRKPLVGSYNFARLPAAIQHLLTGQGEMSLPDDVLGGLSHRYQKVIFMFVDAFGWRFFERFGERSAFLRHVMNEGIVSKFTSQFPSTTTAHVSTIMYGMPVGTSGLYEWNLYEPMVDRIIVPLLFSYAGDALPNTVEMPLTASVSSLAPGPTIFSQLKAQGVRSFAIQPKLHYAAKTTQLLLGDVNPLGYSTLAESLLLLTHALSKPGPSYIFYYYDGIDSTAHYHGPTSPIVEAEIDLFLMALERLLLPVLNSASDTLLLLTADHGQVETAPARTIYLDDVAPNLPAMIKRGRDNHRLVPAGSARDLFLHIQPERIDEAYTLLREHPALAGRAEVCRVPDLIAGGYFAPGEVSDAFLRRVGDLVVLPYAGESVWWHAPGVSNMGFLGHHGGLTPAEMDIPLLALAH